MTEISTLQTHTVIYTEEPYIDWLFFLCEAEDDDHAEEQCLNAYPECRIVWVNEGENYTLSLD